MDYKVKQHIEQQKVISKVEAAMSEAISATNVMGMDDQVAEGILLAMVKAHPTLAQSFVRSFVDAAGILSVDDRFGRDARSQASKEVCGLIYKATEDTPIPFV